MTQTVDGTARKTCNFAVGSWKQTDFELTVPEGVTSATLTLRIVNEATTAGQIAYWDTKVE